MSSILACGSDCQKKTLQTNAFVVMGLFRRILSPFLNGIFLSVVPGLHLHLHNLQASLLARPSLNEPSLEPWLLIDLLVNPRGRHKKRWVLDTTLDDN